MSRLVLDLAAPESLEVRAMLASFALHAIPGAEVADAAAQTHQRVLPTSVGPVAVTLTLATDAVRVRVDAGAPVQADELTVIARRWLDFDTDLSAVRDVLGGDAVIGPLIGARPGLRIIGYPNGFEAAVMTVLGQQVSLAACRTFGGRLAAEWGTPGPGGLLLFPTPQQLAEVDAEDLQRRIRITGARARTVHALAVACAEGLEISADGDRDDIRRRLLDVPGIGPWTADYLAVRVLADHDAFTPTDLVLRRALGGVSAKEATAVSGRWAPYRAYALMHLWASDPMNEDTPPAAP
ncbi:DNA-3-methyladenine glycosylase family protein [Glaciibacter psychrotolerans]|uniref:DNA-3-methyladenine glycosylase II n=1 Tax=Glaciibacter psychrotolerans TaxID=670054 RepID=A0A7Z0J6M7_9MICO|nr:3-methyladenine DNA glycosylase/8-oxoguanine DNA glycosylase [Leifsonia psychrotolerans]